VVGTNWNHTFGYDHAISMFREVWGAAPVATYQLCYDPDNDDANRRVEINIYPLEGK
jgi:hypothetical protein